MEHNYLNNIVVFKNFITNEERDLLYNYAEEKWSQGYFSCDRFSHQQTEQYKEAVKKHLRWSLKFSSVDIFNSLPLFQSLTDRITSILQFNAFSDYCIDPRLGWLMTYILPGGFIQPHTDAYDREYAQLPKRIIGWRHIRFNVMINRDVDESYSPHINNAPRMIDQCDAWCFPADKMLHYMPLLNGTKPRIVCQFGYAVKITK